MIRSAASKVMWVGRATVFLVGLAVILALVFGVASKALGSNGESLIIGNGLSDTVKNIATLPTKLTMQGSKGGPALQVSQQSTNSNASGLGVTVPRGQTPLRVNAGAGKATNLNADKLDGMEPSQLPGSVVTTKGFAGALGDINPNTEDFRRVWFIYGPTVEVTTTSNQRLVGSADAVIQSGTGAVSIFGGLLFDYGLCYSPKGIPQFTFNFVGEEYTQATTIDTSNLGGDVWMSYSPSATVVPGEGTWVVGFCARNPSGKTIHGARVNGWVQVVNE